MAADAGINSDKVFGRHNGCRATGHAAFFDSAPPMNWPCYGTKYGDADSMYWARGMMCPITSEALEAHEDSWINSDDSDEYGAASYFIDAHYSDEEKQELWDERGDKARFRYRLGRRRPEPIA